MLLVISSSQNTILYFVDASPLTHGSSKTNSWTELETETVTPSQGAKALKKAPQKQLALSHQSYQNTLNLCPNAKTSFAVFAERCWHTRTTTMLELLKWRHPLVTCARDNKKSLLTLAKLTSHLRSSSVFCSLNCVHFGIAILALCAVC